MSKARNMASFKRSDGSLNSNTYARKASPSFSGTPTGISATHITTGVLPVGVTGGSGLTALGTIGSGVLSSGVTGAAAVPAQSGHSGKFLTTDATNASWATLSQASILTQSMSGGNRNSFEVRGLDTSAGGGGTGITSLISTHYSFNSSGADGGGKLLLRRSRDTVYLNYDSVMANDVLGKVVFGGSDTTQWLEGPEIRGVAHQGWSSSVQGSFLSFHTKDDGTTTLDERMRIDHNGNVGIGTDTPTVALQVVGDITSSGDITSNSDIRLKSNIRPIDNALNLVTQLEGHKYIKDGKESIGLIAQEVEKILPEFTHTADDEMKTMSVNYAGMVSVLIEAIKDQQEQIDELTN
jgi:hypothetical protein